MHGFYGNGFDGFFHSGGIVMLIIGILLVGAVIYFALKKGSIGSSTTSDSPMETLQKRFVNGDISKEEFLEKKEILGKIR